MRKHILNKNESLEMLSVKYSIPVCMIARANRGFINGIKAGMEIFIPPDDFCMLTDGEYIVKEGETLLEISQKTGTVMREILHINAISLGDMREGIRLFIPRKSRIYTVGCAETLEDIAKNSGVSLEKISELNDVSGGVYRGMQLKLPWD